MDAFAPNYVSFRVTFRNQTVKVFIGSPISHNRLSCLDIVLESRVIVEMTDFHLIHNSYSDWFMIALPLAKTLTINITNWCFLRSVHSVGLNHVICKC